MKKLYIAICAALLVGAMGCQTNREANLPDAVLYIVNNGLVEAKFYDLDLEPTAEVSVHRSGFFESDATVSAFVDNEAIEAYNAANGTTYKAFGENAYQLLTDQVSINGAERTGIIKVAFDYDTIAALTNEHEYVVPVRITSSNEVNTEKDLVLIRPTMLPAEIFFEANKEETVKWVASAPYQYTREITVSVPFENPDDCTFTFDTSNEVLQSFGKYLNLAPADCYSIEGEPTLVAGKSEVKLTLKIDLSKLPTNTYRCSLPLVLSSNSHNYAINNEHRYLLVHLQQDEVVTSVVDSGNRTNIWSLYECNSCQSTGTEYYMNMIDGNTSTYWHSAWKAGNCINDKTTCSEEDPFIVAWNMGAVHNLVGVELTRRNYQDYIIGHIDVSFDGYDWIKVVDFDHNAECGGVASAVGPYYYDFSGDAAVQYIRVCVTKCYRGANVAHNANVAELNVYEVKLAE